MRKSKIADLSVYLPERVVHNRELEKRLVIPDKELPDNIFERLFGVQERRFAAPDEQVSDLAVQAARPIVDRVGAGQIGFLIFASACADLIEPATANIVQHKLRLHCPAMDVKNACNSFTTGLMTASSFIAAGMCDHVLVVNGEKLSDAIRPEINTEEQLCRHIAAFSLGDAGAAALVSRSDEASGFHFQRFMTWGEHWQLCTIPGGGSMFPHDPDMNYFEGHTAGLKNVMATVGDAFFHNCLREAHWAPDDIQHLFSHQVSAESSRIIAQMTGVSSTKNEEVFRYYGNTAAASIPLAMHQRLQRGDIQKGDKIALLGLAAGISVSLQLMVW
ncbi:MAG: ketoacyl-ACP synthase III [Bacteroidetes bacterium]|nr:MAG: ketoacyl-ACP synthase III [Bacteroidota bacterium]